MILALIVAYDRARGIGKDNHLPWRLPAEMAYFKRTTMGKPIVMGRKTFESIGKALPGRRNIVITRGMAPVEGIEQMPSLDAAIDACRDAEEVMVIGGAALYLEALTRAQRIYATEVDGVFDTDTMFPAIEPDRWREVSRERREADDRNPVAVELVVYERRERDRPGA